MLEELSVGQEDCSGWEVCGIPADVTGRKPDHSKGRGGDGK